MASSGEILIVGGGIAGLTLAAALRRRNVPALLVERSPSWAAVGAGISVQPNGMRVMAALGMSQGVQAAGASVARMSWCDQGGQVLFETSIHELWGEGAVCVGIERRALQSELLHGAAGVPARLGVTVKSLVDERERVSVRFDDGSTHTFDLVVGADGLASSVRSLIMSPVSPIYSGRMVWRSVAPVLPCGLRGIQFFLGEGCFFGLCPTAAGHTYGFGNVALAREPDPLEGRLLRLRARFASFGDPVAEFLAALTDDAQIHVAPIEWLSQTSWGTGRVVLIGDAAHASSPMMGQGGSMAMEDALVLAELLDTTLDVDAALEAFVARREPRVAWVRHSSQLLGENLSLPAARRDRALRENGSELVRARYAPLIAPA